MPSLQVNYMGLRLSTPLIAAASSLTGKLDSIESLANSGVGAIVLRSIFEEQIRADVQDMEDALTTEQHAEVYDYLRSDLPMRIGPEKYLQLIRDAKSSVTIPIIASINCVTAGQWQSFARKVEVAGADALELNVYDIPFDYHDTGISVETRHLDIVRAVCELVDIPVAVKIGSQYSSIPHFVKQLDDCGVQAVTLFNRFFQPQINIDSLSVEKGVNFSSEKDVGVGIRWLAILRNRISCDLSLTTGVHSADAAIRGILAGANTVQLCSVLYGDKGIACVNEMHDGIMRWMEQKAFASVDAFRALLSEPREKASRGFTRAQYVTTLLDQ